MRVLLTGATGMVGQGVLLECLASELVTEVIAPVREMPAMRSPKLRAVIHRDFFDWTDAGDLLSGIDACFFCLGVSAVGKSEAEYRRVTYELTIALAEALVKSSPESCFVYVSGQGTNAHGRSMWARVKGETENALLALPFRSVYCFRPGYIQPSKGVRSKVGWYNALYSALGWVYPLLRRLAPGAVTSMEEVGRAMLEVAAREWPERVLGNRAIHVAAASYEDHGASG